MKIEWNKSYTTISAYAILVFLVCVFIYRFTENWSATKGFFTDGATILSPILIGLLIAFLLNPLVNALENKVLPKISIRGKRIKSDRLKRRLSILIAYLILLSLILVMLAIIVPQLVNNLLIVINDLPNYLTHFQTYISKTSFKIEDQIYTLDINEINNYINNTLQTTFKDVPTMLKNVLPNAFKVTINVVYSLIKGIVSLIISIYILANKELMSRYLKRITIAFFPKRAVELIIDTMTYAHKVYSSFFVGQLIDSAIVGCLVFIILLTLKIPFALLISVLIGITNFIPYFGPFIGALISFFLLLIINPTKAIWFLIIILIMQQIDGNIIAPKILGESIRLSPFWIIFSIIVFGSLFGPLGMFFGAPTFKVIKMLLDRYIDDIYNQKIDAQSNK